MRIARVLAVVAVIAAIAVPVAMAFGFVDGKVPPSGTVGVAYSYQFVAANGCPPYEYVIKSGSLPPGLTLSSSGAISGTPTTSGSFLFWAELHDKGCCGPAVSCSTPSQRPFRIDIAAKLTVTTVSPLAPATVGVAYSLKLTADGGGSQTWSIASGALPAGLGLAADGTLSGTPTTATPDPVDVTVKVTDGTRTDTKTLRIDVVTPLAAPTPTVPVSEVGHALKTTTLAATGGRAPYVWALVSGPAWLLFDPATFSFTGTPDAAGSFPVQLTVKDVYGTTVTLNAVVTVKAKVTVKTARLPVTKVGKLFSATLRTAGGVGPFNWKVTSGKFPVGIRLNRTTGVLSGKAQKAGTFPLTFTVKDTLGETSEVSLVLTVNAVKKKKK
jgi:hypothetical protein